MKTSIWPMPSLSCRNMTTESILVTDLRHVLMYVAQALRERGVRAALTFSCTSPSRRTDIFAKLPQQQQLLRALLQFDLLGFQTRRDVRNFLQCVRA